MNAIYLRLCQLMGLSHEPAHAIAGTKAGNRIWFQAAALLVTAIAFTWAAYGFLTGVVGLPMLSALPISLVAAGGLVLIDHHTLVQTRGDPNASKAKSWFIRVVTLGAMLTAGFFLAAAYMKDDINGRIAEKAKAAMQSMPADPRFKAELEGAQAAASQARADVTRAAVLRAEQTKVAADQAAALQAAKDECEGNQTGAHKRATGCGPLARGHANEADSLGIRLKAISDELKRLGDADSRSATTGASVNAIKDRMVAEVNREMLGATKTIEAFIDVIDSSWKAKITVGFLMMLMVIPDTLMLFALSNAPGDTSLQRLTTIENRTLGARFDALSRSNRDNAKSKLSPLVFKAKGAPPRPSATPGAKSGQQQAPQPGSEEV